MNEKLKPRRKKGSGSVQNIGRGKWRGFRTFDGKRQYVYGVSRSEVESKLATLAPKVVGRTLLDAIDVHLEGAVALATKTREGYQSAKSRHLGKLAGVTVGDLTTSDISTRYRDLSKAGLSFSTVNQLHALLKKALDTAVANDWTDRNVARAAALPSKKARKIESIDQSALDVLLEALEEHPLRARFEIGLRLGLRPGEVLGLRLQDIDLDRGILQVVGQQQRSGLILSDGKPLGDVWSGRPKTSKGRRKIGLPDDLVATIRDYTDDSADLRALRDDAGEFDALQKRQAARIKAAQKGGLVSDADSGNPPMPLPGDLIWFSPRARLAGMPLTSNTDDRIWKALVSSAGLPTTTRRYSMRHGTASRLLARAGAGEAQQLEVAALLGHSSPSFTYATYVSDMDSTNIALGRNL